MKSLVVQISGKQGSGKSSLAEAVKKQLEDSRLLVVEHSYAKVLYDMMGGVLSIMSRYKEVPKKDGPLLQKIGEWGRENYGEDVWLDIVRRDIEHVNTIQAAQEEMSFTARLPNGLVHLISDCRFPNEVEGHPGCLVYRLSCPEEVRKARILATPGQCWRPNTQAPSEIGLDNYPLEKFTAVFHTETNSIKFLASMVVEEITQLFPSEKK